MGNAMHGMETRMLLRHCLEGGESKAELARRLGVSRRTIHNWVASGQLDRDVEAGAARYSPRPRPAHKLDPYKGIIDERLSAYPKLSAQRLFEEVRAAGYGGGYGRVKDHVREARPRAPAEPVVRFETPAGWQGQVDFGEFRLPWGRRHALMVVLGYSRLLWLRFHPRQTMDALFAGLEEAFGRFGGVPRELLFDQMRAVVTSDGRGDGGSLVVNAEFQRFAGHWASMRAPAARTGPARRARWSGRSATCGRTSSTAGSSSATRIWTTRRGAGRRASPTSACTARPANVRWTASSGTSGRRWGRWRPGRTSGWARRPRRGTGLGPAGPLPRRSRWSGVR